MAHEIARKRVLYDIPGTEKVEVRSGALGMDIYYPPDWRDDRQTGAVVIVAGYPDAGFERIVGCRFKEMGSTVSWARLIAASGLIAVTYTNSESIADLHAVLRKVPAERIGLWASSGNGPLATSLLLRESEFRPRCAALFYAYTFDVPPEALRFGFVNPTAGKSPDDLADDIPIFIVRAGGDAMPGLNEAIVRFVLFAARRNLPVTFVNHPAAPHGFDLEDNSETTREVIRQALAFLRLHLAPG